MDPAESVCIEFAPVFISCRIRMYKYAPLYGSRRIYVYKWAPLYESCRIQMYTFVLNTLILLDRYV